MRISEKNVCNHIPENWQGTPTSFWEFLIYDNDFYGLKSCHARCVFCGRQIQIPERFYRKENRIPYYCLALILALIYKGFVPILQQMSSGLFVFSITLAAVVWFGGFVIVERLVRAVIFSSCPWDTISEKDLAIAEAKYSQSKQRDRFAKAQCRILMGVLVLPIDLRYFIFVSAMLLLIKAVKNKMVILGIAAVVLGYAIFCMCINTFPGIGIVNATVLVGTFALFDYYF